MAQIISDRLSEWFRRNRNRHRTINNGATLVCPRGNGQSYHTVTLVRRPTSTSVCPHCGVRLAHAELLNTPTDRREYQWPSVA